MEYNLYNLSSEEFEKLCKDILSVYLNKEFRTFPAGRDGGVDIKQTSGDNLIIGQCKRFEDSTQLINNIKKEIPKVVAKNPKEYYVFAACPLSDNKHTVIYNMFSKFMANQKNIFDGNRICSLLSEEKYSKVLEKNFKLWATTKTILNSLYNNESYIDSATLVNKIKEHQKFYVETNSYIEVVKSLYKNNIVLIKGGPGVGKSTISEMVVLNMLSKYKDLKLVYSSYGNISSIKNIISRDVNSKELIYIDDFLGQIYLDLKNEKVSNLNALIEYIKLNKNKYLLLNSRITILNEACNKYPSFDKKIEKMNIYQIEVKNLTRLEKAKILYNHLYFSNIPFEYKKEILDNQRYMKIIDHKNYNPRIIEHITNRYSKEKSGLEYIKFIASALNNPKQIWEEPYNTRLENIDKIFLLTLYGIGTNGVREEIHKSAFNEIIQNMFPEYTTTDHYDECSKRLVDEFIQFTIDDYRKSKIVKVINPSINDVLKSKFDIFNSKYYKSNLIVFEQYLNAYKDFSTTKLLEDLLISKKIYDLSYNEGSVNEAFMLYVDNNSNIPVEMKDYYISFLTNNNLFKRYSYGLDVKKVLKKLCTLENFKKFNIEMLEKEQFKKIVLNILSILDFKDILNIFKLINFIKVKEIINSIEGIDCIFDKIISDINFWQILYDMGNYSDKLKEDPSDFIYEIEKEIKYLLETDVACDLLNYFNVEITDEMIQEHLNQIDVITELEEFEKELIADMRSDDQLDDYRTEMYYEEQDIIEMFENMSDDVA